MVLNRFCAAAVGRLKSCIIAYSSRPESDWIETN